MTNGMDVLAIALLAAMLVIDRLTRQQGALMVAVQTVPAPARDLFRRGARLPDSSEDANDKRNGRISRAAG
jgi:hypothetical protein